MKFPKNFENIAILKIWELVFFWDVKTDFGEKNHNLPLKYWVIEAKVGFWICYCSENWSKFHLETILTTFSEKNINLGTILVKKIFFSCLKMHYFRGISPKWVLTSLREISSHMFKVASFSKFFGDFISHIIW